MPLSLSTLLKSSNQEKRRTPFKTTGSFDCQAPLVTSYRLSVGMRLPMIILFCGAFLLLILLSNEMKNRSGIVSRGLIYLYSGTKMSRAQMEVAPIVEKKEHHEIA
ncbi:hypothetical protein K457DRAFT_194315 [Linnemannia elongata AG-77]|uniref:Uncharacterized protein n=1 Tax=Linnemannia elongata AG-77 TaxID=1314771 RepID=A0A197K983_9FUNG|nr:hypothetical protein K457DRAFT_194315 [Linnemannia elongata AG-77]